MIKKETENPPLFAVIYWGYVKPGHEEEYVQYWRRVAGYFVNKRCSWFCSSSYGGRDEGCLFEVAKPREERCFLACLGQELPENFPVSIREAIEGIRSCLDPDKQLPELSLSVVEEISSRV